MKAMSVLALAAVGVAGAVAAQTTGQYPAEKIQNPPSQSLTTAADGSFRDECGFRYNNRGDRIDERGRVMSPPMTPPNGRSCK
jgi:hypothetical protein